MIILWSNNHIQKKLSVELEIGANVFCLYIWCLNYLCQPLKYYKNWVRIWTNIWVYMRIKQMYQKTEQSHCKRQNIIIALLKYIENINADNLLWSSQQRHTLCCICSRFLSLVGMIVLEMFFNFEFIMQN